MAREIISISVRLPLLPPNTRVSQLPRHNADWPSEFNSLLATITFSLTTLEIGWQPSWTELLEDRSQGTRPWKRRGTCFPSFRCRPLQR